VKLMSKQGHDEVMLHRKQFTRIIKGRTRRKFFSEEKLDSKYLCRGGSGTN
jgi:hypothetical protein